MHLQRQIKQCVCNSERTLANLNGRSYITTERKIESRSQMTTAAGSLGAELAINANDYESAGSTQ